MNFTNSFTEQRLDYSNGRKGAAELIMMVGIGGSGKSTTAKSFVDKDRGLTVRLNRDDLRKMLYSNVQWSSKLENLTREIERESARTALHMGKNVVIDDTNCNRGTRAKWIEFAQQCKVRFRIVTMNTSLKDCVERDALRTGKEHLGEEIIRGQHRDLNVVKVEPLCPPTKPSRPYLKRMDLLKGIFPARLLGRQWVIVDVDGTVADHTNNRSPFDESKVIGDNVQEVIAGWVRELSKHYNICIVSGRHDSCGDDTWDWLELYGIPFDCILMRYSADYRSDTIVKKEILDEIRAAVGDGIAFALDDRPRVIRMWKENGITAYPVRGWVIHSEGCSYINQAKYSVCPDCGALEDF